MPSNKMHLEERENRVGSLSTEEVGEEEDGRMWIGNEEGIRALRSGFVKVFTRLVSVFGFKGGV